MRPTTACWPTCRCAWPETFGFDHVSAISDPAREVSDLGGAVEWFDNQPPAIDESRALLEDKIPAGDAKLPEHGRSGADARPDRGRGAPEAAHGGVADRRGLGRGPLRHGAPTFAA